MIQKSPIPEFEGTTNADLLKHRDNLVDTLKESNLDKQSIQKFYEDLNEEQDRQNMEAKREAEKETHFWSGWFR